MMFTPSAEQAELATMVRDLLRKRSDSAAVRTAVAQPKGYDESLWSVLCEQVGVAALAIPEKYGGAGFTLSETHVVLEELGAALTPSPLLGSAVLAAQAVLLSGDETTCAELLPGIASGKSVAALVWAGPDGSWSTGSLPVTAKQQDGGWVLDGTGAFVLDGDHADVLLVLASIDSRPALFRVDPAQHGVHRAPSPTMDQTLRLTVIDLDGAEATLVSADADVFLPTLRDIACSAEAAMQVGAAQRCLDMTVAYTKERRQFGRPIGSFQALKHRMADMLVEVETARSAAWAAAQSAAQRDEDLPARAALAKAWCSEAFNTVAAETIQLHGGIAITWEHDAHLYFKRAHATAQLFGRPHEHRARLQDLYGLLPTST
ncbi:acyl-CoA dehydrogenase family protein [Haloactinomyces albus]|uniref:Alkylation response protein AidB-like acyl-CoA dehydrogenase n=1 Tax=Haloactinomyces albus TaxID=1352928 RepID=A0AAE4CNE6_9ACTN|nr:acyl-CoA dehydrogenase family protein [Haloactinomyces albus]MDR7303819.1 alkylation response protein AidB-like acyl-CoA dehydrogenase [Haloactinomyces albus]